MIIINGPGMAYFAALYYMPGRVYDREYYCNLGPQPRDLSLATIPGSYPNHVEDSSSNHHFCNNCPSPLKSTDKKPPSVQFYLNIK